MPGNENQGRSREAGQDTDRDPDERNPREQPSQVLNVMFSDASSTTTHGVKAVCCAAADAGYESARRERGRQSHKQ